MKQLHFDYTLSESPQEVTYFLVHVLPTSFLSGSAFIFFCFFFFVICDPCPVPSTRRGAIDVLVRPNCPAASSSSPARGYALGIPRVDKALTMLDESLLGAARSHVPAFVELGRRIRKNISDTEAAMVHKLANALIETANTRLRVLHSMASRFKQP